MEETKTFFVNRKHKSCTKSELENLTKDKLIAKILQLEAHNTQLKNILQKTLGEKNKYKYGRNSKRKFDFSKSHRRHVLLKFFYFGWDYQGFACQEDSASTIEYHLFNALQKACLIETRETSNYHRCGRTDKGVSAFCQVISIDLRSKFPEDEQNIEANFKDEIDYCTILNRILPKNIRCVSWMPLKNPFYSARFDCNQRTYRYFFPSGNLDIEAMQGGCKYLIGTHDFRNFCKMDVANGVTNFMRYVVHSDVKKCRNQLEDDQGYKMYYFEITGSAFLWHQVRCIMSILILIGERNEKPEIIKDLLNIIINPCKPQYTLANSLALNLYYCEFRRKTLQKSKTLEMDTINSEEDAIEIENFQDNDWEGEADTTEWIWNEENLSKIIADLQGEWSLFMTQSTMIREVILDVQDTYSTMYGHKDFKQQTSTILQGVKQKVYQKLLTRKRCESLENRLQHYIKKQRLIVDNSDDGNK